MRIDLHIHSKASDGKFSVQEIFKEAKTRSIGFIAITDHDNIKVQKEALIEAKHAGITYLVGVELNITFSHPSFLNGKSVSLDVLGYQFDPENNTLESKLTTMSNYRQERAMKILDNLNEVFRKEDISPLTKDDFGKIEESVDGTLGRPHIADYLIKTGVVANRQEAFDKYLVKCDVPKFPLCLEEASKLIRDAGGKLVLAHPNDPHGTSLNVLSKTLTDQTLIVQEKMLSHIDGLECWHSRHSQDTVNHYIKFADEQGLIKTGGSDCHQKPIVMGTIDIPEQITSHFL